MTMQFFNTLTGKKVEFKPINPGKVGMYNCGPTVYNYAHIGNLRAFLMADTIKRVLLWNGYEVNQIMNLTDVGHLTGNDGDDSGEDKIEKAAKKGGKTAKEISEFYTEAFFNDLKQMNMLPASKYPKATEHIPEQIAIIEALEKKGYTYKTSDGIYFNTAKFADYGKLGNINLKGLEEGARVEKNDEKRNITDFALWKFSPQGEKRQQEWPSPWGVGFPGWHIECSAMSQKYLGDTFDIHTGGIDHIPVHHQNEIAQSESANDKPFANFWLHNAHVNISGGEKMAKSSGNFLRLQSLIDAKIHPLSYRYYLLGARYSTPMEFSMEALQGAQNAFEKILHTVVGLIQKSANNASTKKCSSLTIYRKRFEEAINDDLNTPEALATLHAVLELKEKDEDKIETIKEFDKVLGLNIIALAQKISDIPADIIDESKKRNEARFAKDFATSDKLRKEIEAKGYTIYDTAEGSTLERELSSLI